MKKYPLLTFFLITFLITWGIAGLFFLFPAQVAALTHKAADAYHPLFRLAARAPTLAAFLIILWMRGKQGLLAFWARYLDFAIPLRWYPLCFGGIVGFGLVLRFVEEAWGMATPALPFSRYTFLPFALYFFVADPGPLGEEGGWRGFALPLLQRHFSPLWVSVLLGVIWSLWHLPAFSIATLNQSKFVFPLFLMSNIALVMLMTAAYNASGGNLPLMILIHWAYNLTGFFVNMDGYYFVANAIGFALAAVLIARHPVKTSFTLPVTPAASKEMNHETRFQQQEGNGYWHWYI
ncbi:MAG: type II CAAX endopeptidase family protein [Caldilineaceae bacterium]